MHVVQMINSTVSGTLREEGSEKVGRELEKRRRKEREEKERWKVVDGGGGGRRVRD